MDGKGWTNLLQGLIARPCHHYRPFVCEGLPSTAHVLVLGLNPAKRLNVNWWDFWDEHLGFNRLEFLEHYKNITGKNKSGGTRARLEHMRTKHGLKLIETNIFNEENQSGANERATNAGVIKALIKHSNGLKAIISHGRDANVVAEFMELGPAVAHYKTKHFSRISYDVLDEVCAKIITN